MERGGHYPKKGGEKGEIQPHPGTSGLVRHVSKSQHMELLTVANSRAFGLVRDDLITEEGNVEV